MRPDDVESARARIARVLTQELRLLSRRDEPRHALTAMTLARATDSVGAGLLGDRGAPVFVRLTYQSAQFQSQEQSQT